MLKKCHCIKECGSLQLAKFIIAFAAVCISLSASCNSTRYYLCGPDEDGCPEDYPEYCLCIPLNEKNTHSAYCLNLDELRCTPLSAQKNCDINDIYPSQGHCLAVIYHSLSTPPCKTTTETFCQLHHSYFCDESGAPQSCHH